MLVGNEEGISEHSQRAALCHNTPAVTDRVRSVSGELGNPIQSQRKEEIQHLYKWKRHKLGICHGRAELARAPHRVVL